MENRIKQKIREAKNISRRNKDKPEIVRYASLVIKKLEKHYGNKGATNKV